MENDLVKMFLTKDGKHRVKIYYHTYAENPRFTTDEPLHCEDWARNSSIMTKDERGNKSASAYNFLCYMLEMYGDKKKIIKILKDNYKSNVHEYHDTALFYDCSNKEWVVGSWIPAWTDGQKVVHEAHWGEDTSFSLKLEDIDVDSIIECLNPETIDLLVANAMTDGVKMMSYSFGYYGDIRFSKEVTCNSEGICWLEHDEFMKYSGNEESYWEEHDCYDISKWLIEEIEAWSNNEVYGYVVEKAVRVQVMKTYFDGEREDESYIETNWEEVDSCWGYYGELSKNLEFIIDYAGYKMEELNEVNC